MSSNGVSFSEVLSELARAGSFRACVVSADLEKNLKAAALPSTRPAEAVRKRRAIEVSLLQCNR
jgi:hypothetical protein